ncbi:MAG: S8 family serine peptidase [Betaproteobacteria bacterium]|nr:S8 family serine peptidase [Betaproteobacteria bacterium]
MKCIIFSVVAITILLSSCTALTPNDQQVVSPEGLFQNSAKQFEPRQILVTLAAKDKDRWPLLEEELLRDYPLTKNGAFPLQSLGIQCLVFIVPAQSDMSQLITELSQDARVDSVQKNSFFINQLNKYSDPYAKLQHGVEQIGAHKVHHKVTGKGVRIAIIDTGIDTKHLDLANQIILQENFVEQGDKSFTSDRHGTAVAGVIAAIANNSIGIYGVAPGAEILGLKSCSYEDHNKDYAICSSWTLARALDFAILESVDIVNFSLSGPQDNLLTRIINEGLKKKIIFVAATDDRNDQLGFPASHPDVIAVMAAENRLAGEMDLQQMKNKNILLAPGKEILSTAPDNSYDFFSGSSLATAIVSGSVALLMEKNAHLPVDEAYLLLAHPESINMCRAMPNSC